MMSSSATKSGRKKSVEYYLRQFFKRDCAVLVCDSSIPDRCLCGRTISEHGRYVKEQQLTWTSKHCTITAPTDAYGIIEFSGGYHHKASQFFRVNYDADPSTVLAMMRDVWNLELPDFVVTVHSGLHDFKLDHVAEDAFCGGLIRSCETAKTWIFTAGVDMGAARYVSSAVVESRLSAKRPKLTTVAITPWGLIDERERFVGMNKVVYYCPKALVYGKRMCVLDENHKHFLLADDGRVNHSGAEIVLRDALEKHVAQSRSPTTNRLIPVVCVLIEGGVSEVQMVRRDLESDPLIPVIVCSGTGGVSDMLAFLYERTDQNGNINENAETELYNIIQAACFGWSADASELLRDLLACMKHKNKLTIFNAREAEPEESLDTCVLKAVLKYDETVPPADLLMMTESWDRCDLAKTEVLPLSTLWTTGTLEEALMNALIYDRSEFLEMLLQNGVSIERFLTFDRLETLYNTDKGPANTLGFILRDECRNRPGQKYNLFQIGAVLDLLLAGRYAVDYYSQEFSYNYLRAKAKATKNEMKRARESAPTIASRSADTDAFDQSPPDFKQPFNDLFVWAVLTKRQNVALKLWRYETEALAKALLASMLYCSLAKEAADDYLEQEVCDELTSHSEVFKDLALDLLKACHREDAAQTRLLLTCERRLFNRETCLSMAYDSKHCELVCHPNCQFLLSDLWHGGMKIRKHSNLRVLLGLFIPGTIPTINFKTSQELEMQPQTSTELERVSSNSVNESILDMKTTKGKEGEVTHDLNKSFVKSSAVNPLQRTFVFILLVFRFIKILIGKCFGGEHKDDHRWPSFDVDKFIAERNVMKEICAAKPQMLTLQLKFYEFYVAPVTIFWIWTISYIIFLVCLGYVALVNLPDEPTLVEWYVFACALALTAEDIRWVVLTEPRLFTRGFRFTKSPFTCLMLLGSFIYFMSFFLRFYALTISDAKVLLAVSVIFWFIRLLNVMNVNRKLGLYITMASKMILHMYQIMAILAVAMVAFGLTRQAIMHPNEKFSWKLVRNVNYKPYFMLYGEVYADEIDKCGDTGENCVPGSWLLPVLNGIYLMTANVLMINLLIAMFNSIFDNENSKAEIIWKYQSYIKTMEYQHKPFLPPPFTIISHVLMAVNYYLNPKERHAICDNTTKVVLEDDQMQRLNDFEDAALEEVCRMREQRRFDRSKSSTAAPGVQNNIRFVSSASLSSCS